MTQLLNVGDKVKLRRLRIYAANGYGQQRESIKTIKKILSIRAYDVNPLEFEGTTNFTCITALTNNKQCLNFTYRDEDLSVVSSDTARYEPVF